MDKSLKEVISSGISNLSEMFKSDRSKESSLGVDIGSSAIKVVQLKKKGGKAVLETYGALALGPYGNTDIGVATLLQAEDLAKALVDLIKESNVTARSGVFSIPSSSSLIFTISLPKTIKEEEYPSIIPIEARKYIPVPMSEISLDWLVIPKEEDDTDNGTINGDLNEKESEKKPNQDKVDVLVVAIHNDIMSHYNDVLQKAQFKSEAFELEIFSNIRSSLGHDLSPVLIMDFGASKTKLTIVENGVIKVFHVVNRGSQDITKNISSSLSMSFEEAEKLKRKVGLDDSINKDVADIVKLSIDYIFSDTNSVVFAYEKKYNKNISKVILSGGGALIRNLQEKATESLKTEVIYSTPFSKSEAPAFLDPVLTLSGPEFSVAFGLALRNLS